mmetsp:Transcript_108063/g.315925  ORF Transcript_108063/g.315925 Transcript_108063/m.315925 type:complete len:380 (-) Transcript_108063:182-1321(-)
MLVEDHPPVAVPARRHGLHVLCGQAHLPELHLRWQLPPQLCQQLAGSRPQGVGARLDVLHRHSLRAVGRRVHPDTEEEHVREGVREEGRGGGALHRGHVHQRRRLPLAALQEHPRRNVCLTGWQVTLLVGGHYQVLQGRRRQGRPGAGPQRVHREDAVVGACAHEVLARAQRLAAERRRLPLGRGERDGAEAEPAVWRTAVHAPVDQEQGLYLAQLRDDSLAPEARGQLLAHGRVHQVAARDAVPAPGPGGSATDALYGEAQQQLRRALLVAPHRGQPVHARGHEEAGLARRHGDGLGLLRPKVRDPAVETAVEAVEACDQEDTVVQPEEVAHAFRPQLLLRYDDHALDHVALCGHGGGGVLGSEGGGGLHAQHHALAA